MSAISNVDLSTGRIGNLYVRCGLCPPFALRDTVESWIAKGIPLSFCVDVIRRYLSQAGGCSSGSGDRGFAWLNAVIQTRWYERSFAMPHPATEQTWPDDWTGDCSTDERIFHKGHRTPKTERTPNPLGTRSAVGVEPRATPATSASADRIIPSGCNQFRSPRMAQAPGPRKIHLAVGWLLTELGKGEQAASVVEAKARSVGIAPRTYDRARKRLGVTSRRIGFGRWAKYVIALPAVHATPNAASIGRSLDEKREGKRKRTKVPN